jgi:rsbT co-antagonist protein RsbR
MLDVTKSKVRALKVTDREIEFRKNIVGLSEDDVARIISLRSIIEPRIGHYADEFFARLAEVGAAPTLLAKRDTLEEAKRRKREHIMELVAGKYDHDYVEQRIDLASLYSAHGLEPKAFFGAFQCMVRSIGNDIMAASRDDPMLAFDKFMSVMKVGYFDIAIIVDVLVAERQRTIEIQQDAIRELSTPVLQVRDRLLILPIIGVLDSHRALQLTSDLLRAIRDTRARMVVIDITGVAAVDSKVANHLIQTVSAARLMGSAVVVTGLSAEVAQALVALGIDLGKIETAGDLQSGLERAERSLGYRLAQQTEAAA